MQLKKVFKGLVIALPLVTVMACTTTDNGVDEAAAKEAAAAQAAADQAARQAEAEKAEVMAMQQREKMEAEQRARDLASLEQDQVVYFDFDTSNLTSSARAILSKHAAFLAANPNQSVVIEGHCDRRGTPEYNIALGERRAKSVQTYLLNAGVSASQISVVSYGEEKPINTYNTEAAFAENRRGVLVYQ